MTYHVYGKSITTVKLGPVPVIRPVNRVPGTPPWDWVHPPGPRTPPNQIHPLDQIHPPTVHAGRYGNKRAVRILLECILVFGQGLFLLYILSNFHLFP